MSKKSEAVELVRRYLGGERQQVAKEVVERANKGDGANMLVYMWREMTRQGIPFRPLVQQLLDDASTESEKLYERGELSWQQQR